MLKAYSGDSIRVDRIGRESECINNPALTILLMAQPSVVSDAVKSVADKIKSFLHFSVPDEGPLTDYESWMPDFMEGLAKGIEKSKGMVAKAVEGVSQDMVINPNVNATSAAMESTSNSSAQNTASIVGAIRDAVAGLNMQGGDTVIPVYIGGTQIDEIILSAQSRQNLRSGGRA